MNSLELKMVDSLKVLRDHYGVVGVKAEFEAEGTRAEEAMRLKDVVTKAGLDLTIKIGGCEALKDLYDARAIGVANIVAPMVESAYALKKCLSCIKNAYPEDESVNVLVNIETKQSCDNIYEILHKYDISGLSGIVLGRVDLTGSMGLQRESVDTVPIMNIALSVFTVAKDLGLKTVVGGGVNKFTIPFIDFLGNLVDQYETRKVIFGKGSVHTDREAGILKAVDFEISWLKNKRAFYGDIYQEDEHRIEMLEKRYRESINSIK